MVGPRNLNLSDYLLKRYKTSPVYGFLGVGFRKKQIIHFFGCYICLVINVTHIKVLILKLQQKH